MGRSYMELKWLWGPAFTVWFQARGVGGLAEKGEGVKWKKQEQEPQRQTAL